MLMWRRLSNPISRIGVRAGFQSLFFSLGNGISSVEAWFSTALDIEEVLSGACDDQLHVLVADVIKSFDTVYRSILDCALGRLGLPQWFRKIYLAYHSQVRLWTKLAAGLGELLVSGWVHLSGMSFEHDVFIVLSVPWCGRLEGMPLVAPQHYADNLKCSSGCPRAFFGAASFTV